MYIALFDKNMVEIIDNWWRKSTQDGFWEFQLRKEYGIVVNSAADYVTVIFPSESDYIMFVMKHA